MSKIATREAYGKALAEIGGSYDNIVVLDADLSGSTKTSVFAKEYPNRFFNMGIAEQNLIGAACGFAASGKVPFASTFAMFAAGRAFEIIRNSVCYPKLNVKICATHAGLTVGEDGGSHQCLEDISIMRTLPNMTVMVPADANDTKKIIEMAADYVGPMYVRLGRAAVPVVMPEDFECKIGGSYELREGNDVTIMACGIMVDKALEAADKLKEEGINARVLNMYSIKPIDEEAIIKASKETGKIVTAEEHNVIGGLGAAVSEVVSENHPVPVKRVGTLDTFGESGKPDDLLEKYKLTSDEIVKKVKELM